jgi:hypothetical protein
MNKENIKKALGYSLIAVGIYFIFACYKTNKIDESK